MSARGFIVFGDDWGGHPSSVQHLFRRIARAHPTLWVNTVGLRPPRLDRNDASRVVRKVRRWFDPPAGQGDRSSADEGLDLHVVSPPMSPWAGAPALRALNRLSMRVAVERAASRLGMRAPVVVTTVPNGVDGSGLAGSQALIYYCVDDFTNWPGVDAALAREMERELLEVAAGVIATSARLAETRRARRGETTILPHGVDVKHFARASDPVTTPRVGLKRGRPLLGYIGLVDERMDVDLVARAAKRRPDWDFVFVGPTDRAPDRRFERDNVRLLPAVPYAELPSVLAAFDVALLPYARNELTRSINPLKLREYLASGRPVVSTSLPEVRAYAPEVLLADDPEAFEAAVESALAGPRDRRAQRASLLAGEDWDDRAERFLHDIARAVEGRAAPNRHLTETTWTSPN